jgi:hypothetical protein
MIKRRLIFPRFLKIHESLHLPVNYIVGRYNMQGFSKATTALE